MIKMWHCGKCKNSSIFRRTIPTKIQKCIYTFVKKQKPINKQKIHPFGKTNTGKSPFFLKKQKSKKPLWKKQCRRKINSFWENKTKNPLF